MPSWRLLLALFAFSLLAAPTQATEICELDAANIPPSCVGYDAYGVFPSRPAGQCPEGSRPELICDTTLPPAQIRCLSELGSGAMECFASPNGLNIALSYSWSTSNTRINLWGDGPDAWLSCSTDVNAVISVQISDDYGNTTLAHKLVSCRKPRLGVQPR